MADDHSDLDDFSSDNGEGVLVKAVEKPQTRGDVLAEQNELQNQDHGQDEPSDEDDNLEETRPENEGGDGEPNGSLNSCVSSSSNEKDRIKSERLEKIRKLRTAKKSKHKTGLVYLSTIPPYMKPIKMRQILSRFGELDRLFLKRENEKSRKRRIKSGGNRKIMYVEGWAEFVRKRDAKLCAQTLNGNIIGGKKGSFYHDDIMNLRYLPGFKWADLTDEIARENDIRQAKLEMEISHSNRLNAEYTKNVEKSKMLQNINNNKKRKDGGEQHEMELPRLFKQHAVASSRADAPANIKKSDNSEDLGKVLNNLI